MEKGDVNNYRDIRRPHPREMLTVRRILEGEYGDTFGPPTRYVGPSSNRGRVKSNDNVTLVRLWLK